MLPDDFDSSSLKLGVVLELTGTLSSFHSELQLKISSAADIKVTGGTQEFIPHQIKTSEVEEDTEGFFVSVTGMLINSSGDSFVIDDGSGPAKVHLMEAAQIIKPKMKKGEQITVTGLVSQYDETYRILPRYQSDIVVGLAQVAGAAISSSSGLPRTGLGVWSIFVVFTGMILLAEFVTTWKKRYNKPK